MTFETVGSDGSIKSEKIFKEIDENTTSYTYRSPTGLLSATQFTQPALTLMEKASFEDMRSLMEGVGFQHVDYRKSICNRSLITARKIAGSSN